jgi:hypothetical protein
MQQIIWVLALFIPPVGVHTARTDLLGNSVMAGANVQEKIDVILLIHDSNHG